jgi:hypothetical protein
MVRQMVAASLAIVMAAGIAGAAKAEAVTTITRSAHGTIITKRHIHRHRDVIVQRRVLRDGFAGSTVSRSRTVIDPAAGTSTTVRETVRR